MKKISSCKRPTNNNVNIERIMLNALLSGIITSITIYLSMPHSDITTSFIIAAVLSGFLASAREMQIYLNQGKTKRNILSSMLLI